MRPPQNEREERFVIYGLILLALMTQAVITVVAVLHG